MTDRLATGAPGGLDLSAAAGAYDVPAGDVDAVLRRASRRTTRRHRALAVVSVVSLVATAAVSVDLLDGGRRTTVTSGTALVRGDVGVTWRAVTPASGLGFANFDTGAQPPLYALSTAPGQADVAATDPRVVWRSDDGVEWTSVSALDGDLFVSDLSARDGRVYAVATGPAAAAAGGRPVSPLLVGWSDDGTRTWQRAQLPVDLGAVAARTTRSIVRSTAVAAGPAGTVVVGVLDASLDVHRSLPAGVTAPHGWAYGATGVDLLGPETGNPCPQGSSPPAAEVRPADPTGEVHPVWCAAGPEDRQGVLVSPQDARGVTASYTWEQLGVDGDLLRAVRRQPVAFFAAAGSDRFERVELPALDPVAGSLHLAASDAGFDLVTTTGEGALPPALAVLTSGEGRSWSVSEVAGGVVWGAATGRVGGALTVVGQGEGGPVVLRADGAGGWTTTSLAPAVDAGPDFHSGLVSAAVGPFGIVIAVVIAPKGDGRGSPDNHRVLLSRDGRTWDAVDVEDLAGRPVQGVIRTAVVGDRALVAVSVSPEGGGRREQVVLVGTPT